MKLTIYEMAEYCSKEDLNILMGAFSDKLSNNNLFHISTAMLYIHLLKYSIWDVKLLRNNIE